MISPFANDKIIKFAGRGIIKMKKNIELEINKEFCKGCSFCIESCPKSCLEISGDLNSMGYHFPVVAKIEECTGCCACSYLCPDMAIDIYELVG